MTALEADQIFITGGTGWLGRTLIEALQYGSEPAGVSPAITRGLRALVQPGQPTRALRERGIAVTQGDLRDDAACRIFLGGGAGGTLIHLAGIIHPRRVIEFEEVNRRGTLALWAAARDAGLKRMVVMSSNSPLGVNASPRERFTEQSPYNPYLGYGASKALMEQDLLARRGQEGPEIVILRAPWFYGPGQPDRQTRFFSMIRRGAFPIIGSGENRRSMGYVANLAQGIVRAAATPEAAGEIFWIADREPYRMVDIIGTVAALLQDEFGIPVARQARHFPSVIAEMAYLADRAIQASGRYVQEIHVLSEMNKTIACSIEKAERMLGYDPQIDLRVGMRRSIAWCLERGIEI